MKRILTVFSLAAVTCIAAAQPQADRTRSAMTVDQKFAQTASNCGQFEVQVSTLAAQRATDPEVKRFAQRMVDEHTKLNAELSRLTQQRRISTETRLNPVHEALLAQLSKESGADFDECYIGMQILAHEGALLGFRKEAKKGDDPQLKSFAERSLPKLRDHMQMARRLCEHGQDSHYETLKPNDKKRDDK